MPVELQTVWDEMDSYGVAPHGTSAPRIDADTLAALVADPAMRVVIEKVREELVPEVATGMVAVADAQGRVLMIAGPDDARAAAAEIGLTTGIVWTCMTGGLNGIGWAVRTRQRRQCFAEMHWKAEQAEVVCDVVPIWHQGRMIAVVNTTDRWIRADNSRLAMLHFFAKQVEGRLAQADRAGRARQCAADQLLEKCDAPALVVQDNEVLAARGLPLRSGDPLDEEAPVAVAGKRWHSRLGSVTFEPLSLPGSWLVQSVAGNDTAKLRATFDFTDPYDPVVRLCGSVVSIAHHVSRPQHRDILLALAYHRAGLDAKSLSRVLYGGDPSRSHNIPPLMSRLRDDLWWLFAAKGYRLAEQLDIEVRH